MRLADGRGASAEAEAEETGSLVALVTPTGLCGQPAVAGHEQAPHAARTSCSPPVHGGIHPE
eukprot:scaffold5769_cov402-Prasinococcus_capsulatus_cf.AAC.7